jgi:hypothetical protein
MSTNSILATTPLVSTNYLLRATGTTIGNSLIWDNGTNVGIGNTNTSYTLDVSGTGRFTSTLLVSGAATFSSTATISSNVTINSSSLLKLGNSDNASTMQIWNSQSGAANNLLVYDNAASAYRFVINSSGNVGIGITDPTDTLGAGRVLDIGSSTGASVILRDTTNPTTQYGAISYNGDSDNGLRIWSTGFIGFNLSSSRLVTIANSGNVLIGTTTDSGNAKLHLATAGSCTQYFDATAYGGANALNIQLKMNPVNGNFYIQNASTGTGVYLSNGGTSWTGVSDERLKTDLVKISDATNKVSQLRALTGRFKTDEEGMSRSFLIAQDVKKVFPEAVNYDEENDIYGIQYTDMIPLLVKAIQEMNTKLDEQNQTIQSLQEQINILAK